MTTQLDVLFEDNHLLVLHKPPGIATMGVGENQPSMVTLARKYLKHKYHKPGNVYVGVVSRLDRLASGVLVFARTSKAAARLSEQLRNRTVQKIYWCLVPACPGGNPRDRLEDWLAQDDAAKKVRVVDARHPAAQLAVLEYQQLGTRSGACWMEVRLETGRKHQIRVQLAHRGAAILGDTKYGSRRPFSQGIALHCQQMTIQHPTRRQPLTFQCEPRWQ